MTTQPAMTDISKTNITIVFHDGAPLKATGDEYGADPAGIIIKRGRFLWLYPWHTIERVECEEVTSGPE